VTIEISSENPRSIRAIELAAGASSWLKCRTKDGQRKAYGVPSRSKPGVYHLVDNQSCDCQDAQRHPGQACMHVLAVRLHCELTKAQQPKPRRGTVLQMVRHADGETSWERPTRTLPPMTDGEARKVFGRL
jgi:hypothetical protein